MFTLGLMGKLWTREKHAYGSLRSSNLRVSILPSISYTQDPNYTYIHVSRVQVQPVCPDYSSITTRL